MCLFISININCYSQERNNDVTIKKFSSPVESVCWSPDGTFYITTEGKQLLFWDNRTDKIIELKSDYDASILSVDISNDGLAIVIVYNDNTFAVHGLHDNKYHTHQQGIGDIPVFDAVFFGNYYTLLLPLDGQNIYTFFCLLTTNESIIKQDVVSSNSYVYGMDISKDSKRLLLTASDGRTHIIDTTTKKEIKSVKGYEQVSINSVFDRAGKRFLYASDEYTINIQDVDSSKELVIKNYDKPVNAADFSPNGKSVAIADKRGFVKIYNAEQGFIEDAYKLDEGDYAFSCQFSPDGRYLLIGTKNGQVIKWEPKYQRPGEKAETFKNDDGQFFVIASQEGIEGQANIFNTQNAKKVVNLERHNIFVTIGAGSIESKNFVCNLKIKTGYHNFQLYPFYWGAGFGVDIGFPSPDLRFQYKVNGQEASAPILLGFAPTAKGGFHYLFDKIGLLAFAELGIGANIRMLTTGGFFGNPSGSFFTDIGIGAQWKFLRAEFDLQIDTNFIYSLNGTIGCSFKIVPPKKKSKETK